MTSHGMGYMCKIEGKMTKALYATFFKMGSWNQLNDVVSTFLMSYFSMTVILNILQNLIK